ncbi:MAG: hypothetical protein UU22_C0002G0036 [Parcubacteria group bacterium GW2011_GWA2_40_8]|nr:MAG: hypothetical protein UT82_C0001G0045 [Parcubacteria group bacterium GW2011_GWB1_40_14]KKR79209.1 MAG: hypothetical protein UU22_C0002G0036 [Parcubacteria group bacterium GW2011_GWA2_40_8]
MLIEVYVKGVLEITNANMLILKEKNKNRYLAIYTGRYEATYISNALLGIDSERPLTQDLLLDVIMTLDAEIKFVTINEIIDGIYYSELVLEQNGETKKIDARPSDSIAIALKTQSPIYVDKEIFNANCVELEEDNENDSPVKEKLPEAFQDFIGGLSELDDLDKPPEK